jgi:hypothetical protein
LQHYTANTPEIAHLHNALPVYGYEAACLKKAKLYTIEAGNFERLNLKEGEKER